LRRLIFEYAIKVGVLHFIRFFLQIYAYLVFLDMREKQQYCSRAIVVKRK